MKACFGVVCVERQTCAVFEITVRDHGHALFEDAIVEDDVEAHPIGERGYDDAVQHRAGSIPYRRRTADLPVRVRRPSRGRGAADRTLAISVPIGQSVRMELGAPLRRPSEMKRIAGLAVMLVSIVGCASSHSSSTPPTSTRAPTTSSAAETTTPPMCRGCGLPAAHAASLCATAYGGTVVESAATDVGTVRAAGIGLVGGMFKKAFPGVNDGEFAAWCILQTTPHCYDEAAVAVNDARQHIVNAGCGWPDGPPRAGPPYWTE